MRNSLIFTVDCVWGAWGEWESCDVSCGGGSQVRRRTVDTVAAHGGTECTGDEEESLVCNSDPCPGKNHILDDRFAMLQSLSY